MRTPETIEIGTQYVAENGNSGVTNLFGSAAPGGETRTDNAEQGSSYLRTDGSFYIKKTAGAGTDKWRRVADLDDVIGIAWRSEKVIVGTGEALAAGARDLVASPFSDDEGTKIVAGDFAQGDYILSGIGGTVKLFKVDSVSAPSITISEETDNPLADNDMFIVRNYLPDTPDDQESQAIVLYSGTTATKISDFNWALGTGIDLSGGYTPGSGDPTAGESLEEAIQKLDGNNDAQDTLLGTSQGALNFGSFALDKLPDNSTGKPILQAIENELERLDGQLKADGVVAAVSLEEVVVDDFQTVEWEVTASLDSDPKRKRSVRIKAMHNGHSGADADDLDVDAKGVLKLGANITVTIDVDLNGAGAAQRMRLRASASAATSFRVQRVSHVETDGI